MVERVLKKKIIIGKDTRLSSDMLEAALAAGITSEGCDAYLAGYCPTPMICYLTVHEDFAVGAMISASHNPFYDNGIKVTEYTSELRPAFNRMKVGQVFGFIVQRSSLYAVKSSIELDSFKESKWDIIGVDPIEKVYYVKRVS